MNKQALSELGQFTGTENYYRLSPYANVVITDGTKFLADNADCYWLFNEIAGAQLLPEIKNDRALQGMQFWSLVKNPQPEQYAPFTLGAVLASQRTNEQPMATLVCERDSGDIAWQKPIPFTDFPFDAMGEVKIWVAPTSLDGVRTILVAYLPSEH